MSVLYIKSVIAGLLFGIWPLIMNRSGLAGNVSSAVFAFIAFSTIVPFAVLTNGFTVPSANWVLVFLSAILGAAGLISFNGMIADARPEDVGNLFVLTTIVQVVVAGTYGLAMNGFSASRLAGYFLAGFAAYLLLR